MGNKTFTLLIIDGDICDYINDITIPALKYEGVSWSEATELARLSFAQGYRLVIWECNDGEEVGGAGDGTTESS